MRNLLGRLNGRTADDLSRVARFWRVPAPPGGPKHRLVGALYRTMTDPRAGRDAWDRLDEREQAMVALLATTRESAVSVADLARRLGVPEATAHEVAARLYRLAIVAREGDDDPLPIGAVPRLFLPIEVAQLFRRVRDERELGDLSGRPLATLLTLLDDTELEEAAGYWGFRALPGLYRRDDLIARITAGVADPDRRHAVVRGLAQRREATRLWDAVLSAGDADADSVSPSPSADREGAGGPGLAYATVPFADAIASAGMTPDEGDPAAELRLRATLSELESRLLLWHTYDGEGRRFLFVPAEIRSPGALPTEGPELPAPVAPDAAPPHGPWRSPDALAWDLLTLLRALGAADAPTAATADALPRPWLRWLNDRLWWAGREQPPAGYLPLLVALAQDEGLISPTDGPHGATLRPVAAAVRAWRDRSFPEQTARLRRRWLALTGWPEGSARADIAIEGADWRGFRRRLLTRLAHLPAAAQGADGADRTPAADPAASPSPAPRTSPSPAAGRASPSTAPDTGSGGEVTPWYPTEDLAGFLAALDEDLLGDTFTAAAAAHTGATERDRRRAAIATAVQATLETAVTWFGVVETGTGERDLPLVRLVPGALDPDPAPTAAGPGKRDDRAPASVTAAFTAIPTGPDAATAPRDRSAATAATAAAGRSAAGSLRSPRPGDGPAARPGSTPASRAAAAPLTVELDGTVTLREPSPVRVWSLLTFADPVALGEVSTWRLTEGALGRALAAGHDLAQVTDFLGRQSRRPLPDPVDADLRGWAGRFRRVRLAPAVTLRPDSADHRDELLALARAADLDAQSVPPTGDGDPGLVVVTLPATATHPDHPDPDALRTLRDRVRAAGFHPA